MSLTEEFSRHDNSTVLMWLIKIRGSSSEEDVERNVSPRFLLKSY